jgi:hypothetical protein
VKPHHVNLCNVHAVIARVYPRLKNSPTAASYDHKLEIGYVPVSRVDPLGTGKSQFHLGEDAALCSIVGDSVVMSTPSDRTQILKCIRSVLAVSMKPYLSMANKQE